MCAGEVSGKNSKLKELLFDGFVLGIEGRLHVLKIIFKIVCHMTGYAYPCQQNHAFYIF